MTNNNLSTQIVIRAFNMQDLDAITALWLRVNISAHDFIAPKEWKKHINDVKSALPKASVTVVSLSSTLIGFIGIIEPHYIAGLFIDDDYQQQGVGKALLDASKQQYSELTLHCYCKNEKAVSFYKRNSFSIIKEKMNEDTNENEYEMHWKAH